MTLLRIALFELQILFYSKRGLLASGLYAVTGLMAATGYFIWNQKVDEKIQRVSEESGLSFSEALSATDYARSELYQSFIGFCSGLPTEQIDSAIMGAPIFAILLWALSWILPTLILLTTYDVLSSPLSSHTFRFETFRASRLEILLGRLLAHCGQFIVGLLLIAMIAIFALWSEGRVGLLQGEHTFQSFLIFLINILTIGVTYCALMFLGSILSPSNRGALFLCTLLLTLLSVGPTIMAWRWGEDSTPVQFFSHLSPTHFTHKLWHASLTEFGYGLLAYGSLFMLYFGATYFIFSRKNL